MIIGQNSCDSMSFANLLRGACLIMREIENESEMKRMNQLQTKATYNHDVFVLITNIIITL